MTSVAYPNFLIDADVTDLVNKKFGVATDVANIEDIMFCDAIEQHLQTDVYKSILFHLLNDKDALVYQRFKRFMASRCPDFVLPINIYDVVKMSEENQVILVMCLQYFFFTY